MSKKQRTQLKPLHVRYRPTKLEDVIGQDSVVRSLKTVLKSKSLAHSYLFTGPSGVGKTTLARIVASRLEVSPRNVVEVDAATNTGVEDMRALKSLVETPGFGGDPRRMVIIDECHSLSPKAWQSWLKIIEEPPEHLFFAFCTTETGKVPRTIKTRCQWFLLKAIPLKAIEQLLDEVCFAEQIKPATGVLRAIANKADGSVRQALVYLNMVQDLDDKKEALQVISQAEESGNEIIQLCRALAKNCSFREAVDVVTAIETTNMEGVRILILNYFSKALMGAKSSKRENYYLAILDEFSEPFREYEGKAPVLLALGRLLK